MMVAFVVLAVVVVSLLVLVVLFLPTTTTNNTTTTNTTTTITTTFTSRWRVCYQRGIPRLVVSLFTFFYGLHNSQTLAKLHSYFVWFPDLVPPF